MSPPEQLSLLFPADITASKRRKPNPLHQAEALPVLGRLILTPQAEGESCDNPHLTPGSGKDVVLELVLRTQRGAEIQPWRIMARPATHFWNERRK